jgi:hypothetical protein
MYSFKESNVYVHFIDFLNPALAYCSNDHKPMKKLCFSLIFFNNVESAKPTHKPKVELRLLAKSARSDF